MFAYIAPMVLIVFSNTLYQICAKEVPDGIHPLASLTVTYLVAAVFSCVLYFILQGKDAQLLKEYSRLNWAPFCLGLVIVGLEVGFIYAYKAGWTVSTAQIVSAAFLAVLLLFVGRLIYHEQLTWNKIVGVLICIGGLALVNYK